jgi:hypothetical protein
MDESRFDVYHPDDGGSKLLCNVGQYLITYTVILYPKDSHLQSR